MSWLQWALRHRTLSAALSWLALLTTNWMMPTSLLLGGLGRRWERVGQVKAAGMPLQRLHVCCHSQVLHQPAPTEEQHPWLLLPT